MMTQCALKDIAVGAAILVRWFDAWEDASWTGGSADTPPTQVELVDVGFFIKISGNYLVIATEMQADSNPLEFRHLNCIPLVNIICIQECKQ